jgi:predicted O-methyltransferase YrrM
VLWLQLAAGYNVCGRWAGRTRLIHKVPGPPGCPVKLADAAGQARRRGTGRWAAKLYFMEMSHLQGLMAKITESGGSFDGTTSAEELSCLAGIARDPKVKIIGEIGFNSGFSSFAFLAASQGAHVYSFDLCRFQYSVQAKQHIDDLFPGRHTLISGDSVETVPRFEKENPRFSFDLIFIDGGHDYGTVKADLCNMKMLASEDSILIIDDLTPWKPWGKGPTRAWNEALQEGSVTQSLLFQDGIVVSAAEPLGPRSRVWAVGQYRM